jgi:methionine biosynthesis protein MetW
MNRLDFEIIKNVVKDNSRVLDVGCETGELLKFLNKGKKIDGRGLEISQKNVSICLKHGLSVVQGDADKDLVSYPSKSFDFVILSQTLQATHSPEKVLNELVRISKRAIVSFPNFGSWVIRLKLLINGIMPESDLLPYTWYTTPNIHLCTIKDFKKLCNKNSINIEQNFFLNKNRKKITNPIKKLFNNFFSISGLFVLKK